jgi:PAS domain S-box-containing protein
VAARYALVLALVGLAAWLKLRFPAYFGPLFILFYPAVMVGAVVGGLGPGLLGTAASSLATLAWVLPAELHGRPLGAGEAVPLAVFTVFGVALSALAESRRRARARGDQEARRREILELEARAAAAQAEALHRYDLLAAHGRDIILFIRVRDGRILDANAAAAAAYRCSRDDLLRLHVQDLRAPDQRAETVPQMAAADAHGLRFETIHLRRDGTTFPVEVDSEGATLAGERVLVSVIRDITDRRRIAEELRDADRRKSEFLALLSHELRNPLAPIRNSASILEVAEPGSEAARRAVTVLGRQTAHLARLVDDLLDLTRVTHGKIELQPTRVDAGQAARQCCDDVLAEFQAGGVGLECLATGPAWVEADPARLAQLLGNLLTNALKFTPPGGRVEVRVERGEAGCRISVRDDGVGIEPEDLGRIFQPFFQSARSRLESRGGLGLGLPLVQELARLHGGEVTASSRGPGQGSEFAVTLPLVAPPPAAEDPPRRPKAPGLSILLVEDELDAGTTLAELLGMAGHRVEVATSGRAGVEAAARQRRDVLICDVGLPDMSGFQVVREIRAAPATGRLLAIALTGHALPQDRAAALEAGFDAHLAKPLALERLTELLDAVPRPAPAP